MTDVALAHFPPPVGFGGRGRARLLELGVRAHVAYQAEARARDPSFAAEVAVRAELELEGFRVTLGGRCDGVRQTADGLRVEELKLARSDPPADWERGAASLQAALYAWLLAEERAVACSAELVWLRPERSPRRELVDLQREAARERCRAAVAGFVAAAREREAELARRRGAAPALRAPFPVLRPGQAEISRAVERALEQREHLLIEAPTGLGKTAAALPPALRHALAHDLQLYVLTSRTLQQRLALETLRAVAPAGVRVAARLRAKARMCATGELVCHERACGHARGHRRAVESGGLRERAFEGGFAVPDAVFSLARDAGACPYELMSEAAREACAVVADTNYAFHPSVALAELRDPSSLARSVLVVDEAHGLPARVRDALSARLDVAELRGAIERIALGSDPLHRRQRELAERLVASVESAVAEAVGGAPDASQLAGLDPALAEELAREADAAFEEALLGLGDGHVVGPLAGFLGLAFHVLQFFETPEAGTHRSLAGRSGGGAWLERACIDAAPALARVFAGAHAVIGLSATLSPPEWHARLLGLDADRLALLRVRGASRSERLRVVVDPRVDTRFVARQRELGPLASKLAKLAASVPGHTLAVGPSFAWLAQLAERLRALGCAVVCEGSGADAREREAWITRLREGPPALALAVAGGALTEGFDTAGLGLAAVAVLGPCLPALEPKSELRRELLEETFGDGFALAYALPGMTRVIQSVGRLLRRDEDRGVVVLFGERFLREPYRSLLPEDWLRGGSAEDLVADPARAARAFFATA